MATESKVAKSAARRWFRLTWSGRVEAVMVTKETEQFVTYIDPYYDRPQRRAKAGEYFPTFDALKQYQIERCERRLQSALDESSRAKEQLNKAREMTEPKKEEVAS